MINRESIVSAFNERGTLLKWLKKVEKALRDSVLNSVEVRDAGDGLSEFAFIFDDGSEIVTPPVNLGTPTAGELYQHSFVCAPAGAYPPFQYLVFINFIDNISEWGSVIGALKPNTFYPATGKIRVSGTNYDVVGINTDEDGVEISIQYVDSNNLPTTEQISISGIVDIPLAEYEITE